MRSFISRVANFWRTRRLPRAGADCSDFLRLSPPSPTASSLSAFLRAQSPGASASAVRGGVFDLFHRCGAAGRCACAGRCRFPLCATLRPLTKGAEILAARRAVEDEANATAGEKDNDKEKRQAAGAVPRELIALAHEERITEAVEGVARHAGRQLREDERVRDAETRAQLAALYQWRAALLVNIREDERAVSSLLNLAARIACDDADDLEDAENCRARLIAAATTWAALNDMEVIYYRSLLQQCQPFPLALSFARDRPLLLRRVFEFLRTLPAPSGPYLTQSAAHIVLAKEITAAVSRAQAAQQFGDATEDPLRSACIPLALRYYRFCVDDALWSHILNLLCMPPAPAPAIGARPEESGLMPTHILDAVGRSMLLHHLLALNEARESEIESGAAAERAQRSGEEAHPAQYERVMSKRDAGIAVARMRELLQVVRAYEDIAREEEKGREGGKEGGPDAGEK